MVPVDSHHIPNTSAKIYLWNREEKVPFLIHFSYIPYTKSYLNFKCHIWNIEHSQEFSKTHFFCFKCSDCFDQSCKNIGELSSVKVIFLTTTLFFTSIKFYQCVMYLLASSKRFWVQCIQKSQFTLTLAKHKYVPWIFKGFIQSFFQWLHLM